MGVVGEYSWCASRYSLSAGRRASEARTAVACCTVATAAGGAGMVVSATQLTTPTAATDAAIAQATAAGVATRCEGASTVGSLASWLAKRRLNPGASSVQPRKLSPM